MSTRPDKPIRRCDIFAEYRKQDEQASGMRADEARGYGLWVAKVVAARKFGRMRERGTTSAEDRNRRRRKWHVLSGKRQTDRLFDHEIVERMGAGFCRDVFEPAVRAPREQGQSYEAIAIVSAAVGSRPPWTDVFSSASTLRAGAHPKPVTSGGSGSRQRLQAFTDATCGRGNSAMRLRTASQPHGER